MVLLGDDDFMTSTGLGFDTPNLQRPRKVRPGLTSSNAQQLYLVRSAAGDQQGTMADKVTDNSTQQFQLQVQSYSYRGRRKLVTL